MSIPHNANNQVLIFTDLDGTLLDHYTYSYEAAQPCIHNLTKLGVPIVFNTSKALAEASILHSAMGLSTPIIVENGAAIYIPLNFFPKKPKGAIWQNGYWVKIFAQKRNYWQGIIKKASAGHEGQFETFGDMTTGKLSEVTGLGDDNVELASQRQFGEPILWTGTHEQREEFIQKVRNMGAFPLEGARFLHICGDSNKGKALMWLLTEYQRQHPTQTVTSIALGDSNNDIDMLEVADTAVRILSPIHDPPELTRNHKVYTSQELGPKGWQEMMQHLFPELKKGDY